MRELDTGTDHLLAKVENGVGYLIMNRPEARNAMSAEMNEAMQKNIADFELNNEVRCIVLTGAGNAFCAGGDVKGMSSRNSEGCLLYTSPSPRDPNRSRMPSSA